jgi:hypothetical protein
MKMRRAEVIFAIVVLLGLPLTLLAGIGANGMSMCDRACCLPHARHAAQVRTLSEEKTTEGMSCHHGEAGDFLNCTMKSNSRGVDYTILAPLPPTNLSSSATLVLPVASRRVAFHISQDSNSGFLSAPFEPPRT